MHKVIILLLGTLLSVCPFERFYRNDYEYYSRRSRQSGVKTIQDGELYRIQNQKNRLYLTAKERQNELGVSSTKAWNNSPNQIWEVTKLDKGQGYILKPLFDEYNSITSQILNKAHSFHTYVFYNLRGVNWLIEDIVHSKCLTIAGENKVVVVASEDCDEEDTSFQWQFQKIE